MNIYLRPPQASRGLQRIADALTRYRPADSTIVVNPDFADLVIIYAIGRQDAVTRQVQNIVDEGRRYAIVQCCLRSTMRPHTEGWRYLWDNAAAVWSYYDLNRAIAEDGDVGTAGNFYHAPLGADAQMFQVHPQWRGRYEYVILSSGGSRLSESVRECHLAAQIVGRHSAHLGAVRLNGVDSHVNLPDPILRSLYNLCEFVSGLRRTEGFELPAIEGLLCGCRPIVFDSPDYHHWYEPFAEFIHEGTRAEVVEQLVALFKQGARPVTEDELQLARERFNWETIIDGFYQHIAAGS